MPRTTHFDRLWIDFAVDFHRFSRLHRASNSKCSTTCRTFVFAGRCGTSEGSLAQRRRRKATHFVAKSPQRWFANESSARNFAFVVPGRDFTSIWVASARSRAFLGARFGVLGCLWRRSERYPGVPGTPRDAPGTLRERPWAPRGIPGASPDRFWVDRGFPERVVTHLELSTSIYLGVRATPRDPLRSTEAPPPSPTWLDGANSTSRLERSGQPRLDVTSTWLTRSCMAIVDTAYRLADRRTCIAQAATICLHRPPHASSLVHI